MAKRDRKLKQHLTLLRMAGNIASGIVGRYSSEDLKVSEKRQQRIAKISVNLARMILEEADGA